MSSLLDSKQKMLENSNNKVGFILVSLFLIWLFFPNNNSFIKLSYWSNNVVYSISKLMHINKTPEYMHYRNNAVYLAKVYPKNSAPSFNEMDRAIAAMPENIARKDKITLYRDSALLKLYYGDKKGALEDYLSSDEYDVNDNLRIAILLADEARYREAVTHCNLVLSANTKAISGNVCLSYVYEKLGDIDSAMQIYDYLIEMKPKSEMVYLERSYLKKRIGDEQGSKQDLDKAKSLSRLVQDNGESIIDKMVNIKELPLSII